jgi:hypothetical protein
MAVFTRTNGNAQNVVSVGNIALSTEASSLTIPISTGIGKPIQAFGITSNVTMATQMGTGEAVEGILRVVGVNSTLLAYQVNTTLLSVVIEESSWNATDLQANIRAANGTVGSYNLTGVTVTDVGLKLATS